VRGLVESGTERGLSATRFSAKTRGRGGRPGKNQGIQTGQKIGGRVGQKAGVETKSPKRSRLFALTKRGTLLTMGAVQGKPGQEKMGFEGV